MKTTVNKNDLIQKLESNMAAHRAQFEAAQAKYREAILKHLEAQLQAVRDNKPFNLYLSLPAPQDQTYDYKRTIGLLKMSTETIVELGEADYARYVLDNWDWTKAFKTVASSYGIGSPPEDECEIP